MGSATVSQAGEGSTASCPGPSAQTSATATGPSYQTLGCAAVTQTGWDPTALWVSTAAGLLRLKESNTPSKDGLCGVAVRRIEPLLTTRYASIFSGPLGYMAN